MEPIGLYIHVPFCTQKCPYCDFYSLTDTKQMNDYTDCIINKFNTFEVSRLLVASTIPNSTLSSDL